MEHNVAEQQGTKIDELKETQQTNPVKVEEKKPTLVERFERWLEPMVLLTAIIMFATLLYAVFSFFLWKVTEESVRLTRESIELTRKSVEIAEKTFSRQYRPYIGVSHLEVEEANDKKPYALIVPVKNFGSIPAHNISVKLYMYRDGIPVIVTNSYGLNELTLFPQQEFQTRSEFAKMESINLIYAEPQMPEVYNTIEFEVRIDYHGIGEQRFQSYSKWELIKFNSSTRVWVPKQQSFE